MTSRVPPGTSGPAGSARVVTGPRSFAGPAARVRLTGPRAHVGAASRRALVPGQAAADEVVGAGDVGDQDGGRVRAAEDDRLAARIRAEVLVMEVWARGEPGAALTAA